MQERGPEKGRVRGTLVVGVKGDYKPWGYRDASGKIVSKRYGANIVAFTGNAEAEQALRDRKCIAWVNDDSSITSDLSSGQWEAAESLACSRQQTLWRIILPQCFKRMIPPWMNRYAILTMAMPLCSLLGVEELITLSRQAMEAENNHPELPIPFYGFALIIFFAYCYPIARLTLRLERRFTVKLQDAGIRRTQA